MLHQILICSPLERKCEARYIREININMSEDLVEGVIAFEFESGFAHGGQVELGGDEVEEEVTSPLEVDLLTKVKLS